jgi:hypothetical protein
LEVGAGQADLSCGDDVELHDGGQIAAIRLGEFWGVNHHRPLSLCVHVCNY